MLAFLSSLLDLLGIVIKSIIKSCAPRHGSAEKTRKSKKSTSVQSNHKESKHSSVVPRERTSVPKKPRRASVTERTVSSSERTVVFELEGSSSSPDPKSEETKT